MADTIYTRTLAQGAEAQGSTQALATLLRVPENTLLRWMCGRAQMPVQAFLKLVELLAQHESKGGGELPAGPLASIEKLSFNIGQQLARCARCDGTQFVRMLPGLPLRMTSELECTSCGEQVVHGDLISQLARDAVQHSRAMTVARAKRQAARIGRPAAKRSA